LGRASQARRGRKVTVASAAGGGHAGGLMSQAGHGTVGTIWGGLESLVSHRADSSVSSASRQYETGANAVNSFIE